MRSSLKIVKPEPAYEQVKSFFHSLIVSGEWAPGYKLPKKEILAKRADTSVFTVQTALERLCREGYLERKPKVGTYVKGATVRLSHVGIYFGDSLWDNVNFGFYQALCRELQTRWAKRNVKTSVFVDDRTEPVHSDVLPALRRAVEKRNIQAVVAPMLKGLNIDLLKKLKVPISSKYYNETGVGYDWTQMMESAMERLKAQHCRSVGIICPADPQANGGENGALHNAFILAAQAAGLKTCEAWVRFPAQEVTRPGEEYGYQEFDKLWSQKQHPDGLIVYPDITVRGVITALLARGVSVPKELKLVLHKNDLSHYFCPIPATQVVTSVGAVAEAYIELISSQLKKQPYRSVRIPFEVQEHDPAKDV